jgi:hypothetical protein
VHNKEFFQDSASEELCKNVNMFTNDCCGYVSNENHSWYRIYRSYY